MMQKVGDELQNEFLNSIVYPSKSRSVFSCVLQNYFFQARSLKCQRNIFLSFSEKRIFSKFVEIIRNRYKWLRIGRRFMKGGRKGYAKMTAACI